MSIVIKLQGETYINLCTLFSDICEDFFINCTTTAGCHNESGMAECFCKSGFELTDNGTNCKGKSSMTKTHLYYGYRELTEKDRLTCFGQLRLRITF